MDSRFNFAAPYFADAAREAGCELLLHPDGGFAGQIRLPDGSKRYFVRSSYDINLAGAWHVARDKALTKDFLQMMGYPVLPGRAFFSDRLGGELSSARGREAASRYAAEIGFPVMVKANSSSGGHGVERADDAGELDAALSRAFRVDEIALVERYAPAMRDYRLLVLDGEILVAYERRPAAVIGDGVSSIRELVDRRPAGKSPASERIEAAIARPGFSWSSMPERGVVVRLVDVANLEQGGTAVDVTESLSADLAAMAIGATRDMGLRLCGVDVLVDDAAAPSAAYVIEMNASPTIHNFATLCREERLRGLYSALFGAMTGSGR
jgi:D-alanine-D-alanine ligase-like ATP-grasp enzyme